MTGLQKVKKSVIRNKLLYIMLLPMVIFFILFHYKPLYGLQIAFKDYSVYKGISASPWVGFEHFILFFKGPYFVRTLSNTFLINILGLLFQFPAPIIFALLLNEIKNGIFKKVTQTMTYLPHFISSVILAGIIINFLSPSSGIINHVIEIFGGERTYFIIKSEWFRPIYISMGIWANAGFNSIIYMAALASVPVSLYESATIDGANRWKQALHITIPSILPVIMVMLIIRLGTLLNVGYETILLLQQDANLETSDVISTYVFRAGIREHRYDYAAAVDLLNSVVALILVSISNWMSKKVTEYGLW